MAWFEDVVSALAYSVALERVGPGREPPYNDVAAFVVEQVARMPDPYRLPLKCLTLAFDLSGLAGGKRFHRREPPARRVQLERWRSSPFGPCRDLVRFYESLALFALYSRPEPS